MSEIKHETVSVHSVGSCFPFVFIPLKPYFISFFQLAFKSHCLGAWEIKVTKSFYENVVTLKIHRILWDGIDLD